MNRTLFITPRFLVLYLLLQSEIPVGHTAVLLITQYARMTQCTTVLRWCVQFYDIRQTPRLLLETRLVVLETRLLLEQMKSDPRLLLETRLVFETRLLLEKIR